MTTERDVQRVLQMMHFGRTLKECHDQLVEGAHADMNEEEFYLAWQAALMVDAWRQI